MDAVASVAPARGRPRARAGRARRSSATPTTNTRDPWNAALVDAGAQPRFRRWSDEAIRAALAEFWTRTGRALTADDLRAPDWHGPTSSTLRRRYGGVERAWETLGPVPA